MKKNSHKILFLCALLVLSFFKVIASDFMDEAKRSELIKEGKRQIDELIRINKANEKVGRRNQNKYIFFLDKSQTIDYASDAKIRIDENVYQLGDAYWLDGQSLQDVNDFLRIKNGANTNGSTGAPPIYIGLYSEMGKIVVTKQIPENLNTAELNKDIRDKEVMRGNTRKVVDEFESIFTEISKDKDHVAVIAYGGFVTKKGFWKRNNGVKEYAEKPKLWVVSNIYVKGQPWSNPENLEKIKRRVFDYFNPLAFTGNFSGSLKGKLEKYIEEFSIALNNYQNYQVLKGPGKDWFTEFRLQYGDLMTLDQKRELALLYDEIGSLILYDITQKWEQEYLDVLLFQRGLFEAMRNGHTGEELFEIYKNYLLEIVNSFKAHQNELTGISNKDKLIHYVTYLSDVELLALPLELRKTAIERITSGKIMSGQVLWFFNFENSEDCAIRLLKYTPKEQAKELLYWLKVSGVLDRLDKGLNDVGWPYNDNNYIAFAKTLVEQMQTVFVDKQVRIAEAKGSFDSDKVFKMPKQEFLNLCNPSVGSEYSDDNIKVTFYEANFTRTNAAQIYSAPAYSCQITSQSLPLFDPYDYVVIYVNANDKIGQSLGLKGGTYCIPAIVLHIMIQERGNENIRKGLGLAVDAAFLAIGIGELASAAKGIYKIVSIIDVATTSINISLNLFETQIRSIVGDTRTERFMNAWNKIALVAGLAQVGSSVYASKIDNIINVESAIVIDEWSVIKQGLPTGFNPEEVTKIDNYVNKLQEVKGVSYAVFDFIAARKSDLQKITNFSNTTTIDFLARHHDFDRFFRELIADPDLVKFLDNDNTSLLAKALTHYDNPLETAELTTYINKLLAETDPITTNKFIRWLNAADEKAKSLEGNMLGAGLVGTKFENNVDKLYIAGNNGVFNKLAQTTGVDINALKNYQIYRQVELKYVDISGFERTTIADNVFIEFRDGTIQNVFIADSKLKNSTQFTPAQNKLKEKGLMNGFVDCEIRSVGNIPIYYANNMFFSIGSSQLYKNLRISSFLQVSMDATATKGIPEIIKKF